MKRQWQAMLVLGVAAALGTTNHVFAANQHARGNSGSNSSKSMPQNGGGQALRNFNPPKLNNPSFGSQFGGNGGNLNNTLKHNGGLNGNSLGGISTPKLPPASVTPRHDIRIGNSSAGGAIKDVLKNVNHQPLDSTRLGNNAAHGISLKDLGPKLNHPPHHAVLDGVKTGIKITDILGNHSGSHNGNHSSNGNSNSQPHKTGHNASNGKFCWPNYCFPHHHHHCPTVVIDCCDPCYAPVYCPPVIQVTEVVVVEIPVQTITETSVVVPGTPSVFDPSMANTLPAADAQAALQANAAAPGLAAAQATAAEFTSAPAAPAAPAADATETAGAKPADADLIRIPLGAQVQLKGKDLGTEPGKVVVQIGELAFPTEMKDWKPDLVTALLPQVGVKEPTKGFIHILKADGKPVSSMPCLLVMPVATEAAK